jgi:hypothetical protein
MCISKHLRVTKATLAEYIVFVVALQCVKSLVYHRRFHNIYFISSVDSLNFGCTIKLF